MINCFRKIILHTISSHALKSPLLIILHTISSHALKSPILTRKSSVNNICNNDKLYTVNHNELDIQPLEDKLVITISYQIYEMKQYLNQMIDNFTTGVYDNFMFELINLSSISISSILCHEIKLLQKDYI